MLSLLRGGNKTYPLAVIVDRVVIAVIAWVRTCAKDISLAQVYRVGLDSLLQSTLWRGHLRGHDTLFQADG